MLGNLKEFLSVVHDGLSTNNNFRHTLHEVQKVTSIFKEKQKVSKENKVNFSVGGDLLSKYQEEWAEIHNNADKNAKIADEAHHMILDLHNITKSRLRCANEFVLNTGNLANLTSSVAECMDGLRNLQVLMKDVEKDLIEFEELVERGKMENWKLDHHYQLTLYKENKMAALEKTRTKLASENSVINCNKEKQHLADLQVRRENSAAAFENDINNYLKAGTVPSATRTTQNLSLEQVELEDDNADLEKFLDS